MPTLNRIESGLNDRDIPYDFLSVMQYSGIDPQPGYERYAKNSDSFEKRLIGQRRQLSPKDVELINIMYRCPMNGK